ncbi:MAG: hypothetical protein IJV62_02135, partial [Eggerthellaceae bacterium]|nr:hypothetical protein [Eggerthellaceae bacterium]
MSNQLNNAPENTSLNTTTQENSAPIHTASSTQQTAQQAFQQPQDTAQQAYNTPGTPLPNKSKALIYSIIGLVSLPISRIASLILSIMGISGAKKELKANAENTKSHLAKILGILGTVLSIMGLIIVIGLTYIVLTHIRYFLPDEYDFNQAPHIQDIINNTSENTENRFEYQEENF